MRRIVKGLSHQAYLRYYFQHHPASMFERGHCRRADAIAFFDGKAAGGGIKNGK